MNATTLINDADQLQDQLQTVNQEHLLQFWSELNDESRDSLTQQIKSIDFSQVAELYKHIDDEQTVDISQQTFGEPQGNSLIDAEQRFDNDAARQVGECALRTGTIGVAIVAGGQGTRLGFAHPKGTFPIGPVSNASLFEILIGKIRSTAAKYDVSIPLFLMTSPATHEETIEFLEQHDRFGLAQNDLVVFCQGTMPAVDLETGKLILANKGEVFRSPDGHGGMLDGLRKSNAFGTMRGRGIEHLFYAQIDNALIELLKPETIGQHILYNSDATTVVVRKSDPLEKVGNVAVTNGKTQIIEYSDLPQDVAERRKDDGDLLLWAGNVGVHVWDVSFLESVAEDGKGLPFHYARKKVPFVNDEGEVVQPEVENAVKFERFIFDLLPMARRAVVVECDRAATFAPLKNPTGTPTGSPEAVQQQILELHHGWIIQAGGSIRGNAKVEISPLYANSPEDLAARMQPGTSFTQDTYLKE